MEIATTIIKLLVGLVVFVTGMSMMSSGLKKSAGHRIKTLFRKIKDNRLASIAIGAGTTASLYRYDRHRRIGLLIDLLLLDLPHGSGLHRLRPWLLPFAFLKGFWRNPYRLWHPLLWA